MIETSTNQLIQNNIDTIKFCLASIDNNKGFNGYRSLMSWLPFITRSLQPWIPFLMSKVRQTSAPYLLLETNHYLRGDNNCTINLQQEINLHNCTEWRSRLFDALNSGRNIVVDFSRLNYIDSAGIAIFLEVLNFAKGLNLSMVFIGVQGLPLQLIKLTRLNQVFTLVESEVIMNNS